MKMLKLSAICAAVVLLLTSAAYVDRQHLSKRKPMNFDSGKGFAVLELFTSEGCSSCPPAEALLERIQKEAGDKPVYILAYHVDYWNRLGWKDVFSSPEFSKRQYWYNRKFTSEVYTPQLIVNGKTEFVGSDEEQIRNTLTATLNGTATPTLSLQAHQVGKNLNVTYRSEGGSAQSNLVLALVQKHAVSIVKAGENEGRTLTHAQIVKQLSTFSLSPGGKGCETVALPTGFDTQKWELIGFIQKPDTGEILAATKTSVPSPSASL
ncbi:DUF1223 domain-containing protein [Mucilaginibacter sp. 14171R-50]|uniref:DUF1223 domain-containing protein n=1 Tax=Mucilaginibacter sp. 14171R-50 TaxID=2703789 RepID=UPI00138C099A|nr:DUF1223 domain-containing protein [Mucilaginibacter sp. 14171R-50]QHS56431.1 DUF1223 domain-containing protein [Mucilaginibacter sp. 14171R-50]